MCIECLLLEKKGSYKRERAFELVDGIDAHTIPPAIGIDSSSLYRLFILQRLDPS